MELFYAHSVEAGTCYLDAEESGHCVRVLRHRAGDEIDVIDGLGTLYHCRLTLDSPKGAQAMVLSGMPDWGSRPYRLTIGCCPTKNNDRFVLSFAPGRTCLQGNAHGRTRTCDLGSNTLLSP